ncbi:hypothetical protein VNO77_30754 [Canavalia gladiata]|uniref:Uncharacterized protein n=1 Tax=Canavalia gladiata TaxID=3824 RepID=A0AAN9KPR7_CANGL
MHGLTLRALAQGAFGREGLMKSLESELVVGFSFAISFERNPSCKRHQLSLWTYKFDKTSLPQVPGGGVTITTYSRRLAERSPKNSSSIEEARGGKASTVSEAVVNQSFTPAGPPSFKVMEEVVNVTAPREVRSVSLKKSREKEVSICNSTKSEFSATIAFPRRTRTSLAALFKYPCLEEDAGDWSYSRDVETIFIRRQD